MPSPYIGLRCPNDLHEALVTYLKENGEKLSPFILRLIAKEIGFNKANDDLSIKERLEILEKRVASLENKIE
ncbi:hypothetical protein [Pseudanabaena sp. 'Roaring Creek']|uniref:hypothetical protein n=1 Tax=Pseudanabaena sp. 'Roaring Creek' TaxID=1681830 RepID=UPI0006D8517D|nr:hypothetical protein [Pseudanabaena sp. 'Roaring Creek']